MYKKIVNNVFFEKLSDFENAILGFFKNITLSEKELSSLMTLNFHINSRTT